MATDDSHRVLPVMADVDVHSLSGLTPSQRLKAAADMADQMMTILDAVERGEIDASTSEVARLQGAVLALRTVAG